MKLAEGELRYLRIGSSELIRRVYFGLRHETWDTPPPKIVSLTVDDRGDAFRVRLEAHVSMAPAEYRWTAVMEGSPSGVVTFEVETEAMSDFETPRVGLCVLFGGEELSGQPFDFIPASGRGISPRPGMFPRTISPGFVCGDFTALSFTLRGDTVRTALSDCSAGDNAAFVMEDQRNFGDSSFKAFTEAHNSTQTLYYDPSEDKPKPVLYGKPEDRLSLHRQGNGLIRKGDTAKQKLTLSFQTSAKALAAEVASSSSRLVTDVHVALLSKPGHPPHPSSSSPPAEAWPADGILPMLISSPATSETLEGASNFATLNRAREQVQGLDTVTFGFRSSAHLYDDDSQIENLSAIVAQAATLRTFADSPSVSIRCAPILMDPPYDGRGLDPRVDEPFCEAWAACAIKCQLPCMLPRNSKKTGFTIRFRFVLETARYRNYSIIERERLLRCVWN